MLRKKKSLKGEGNYIVGRTRNGNGRGRGGFFLIYKKKICIFRNENRGKPENKRPFGGGGERKGFGREGQKKQAATLSTKICLATLGILENNHKGPILST